MGSLYEKAEREYDLRREWNCFLSSFALLTCLWTIVWVCWSSVFYKNYVSFRRVGNRPFNTWLWRFPQSFFFKFGKVSEAKNPLQNPATSILFSTQKPWARPVNLGKGMARKKAALLLLGHRPLQRRRPIMLSGSLWFCLLLETFHLPRLKNERKPYQQ